MSHCNEKYRYEKCNCEYLNVQAPECLLKNKDYSRLYKQLYRAILKNDLEIKLENMIKANNEVAYNKFLDELVAIFELTLGSDSPRLLVTESDGTVIYDTSDPKSPGPGLLGNSFQNWKQKLGLVDGIPKYLINENHNTRVAVLNTQLCENGVGYESKFSSSTNSDQAYVAIRAGQYLNNSGTFRLSKNV